MELPAATPELPMDVFCEIVARSDAATVIRCAATSKTLRGAIVDPAFRRRLALRAAENEGGFDPALFLGVAYHEGERECHHRVIGTPIGARLSESFKPVASRGSLLVLRKFAAILPHQIPQPYLVDLLVYNAFTGQSTSLPTVTVSDAVLPPVLLAVGDAGRSFELLVMGAGLQTQTFSSEDVRETALAPYEHSYGRAERAPHPAIVGRTVYWPFSLRETGSHLLALDVDAGEATTLELPPRCFSGTMATTGNRHLLSASARGQVRVLVAESVGISMWTLASPGSPAAWSRRMLIGRPSIERQVGLDKFLLVPFRLLGLGEKSGVVVLEARKGELLRLDLGCKEPTVARLKSATQGSIKDVCLYEIDLVSLLQSME